MTTDEIVTPEMFAEAARECRTALNKCITSSLEVREKLGRTVNDSHLKGVLTMMRDDIFFRSLMAKTGYGRPLL